MSIKTVMIVDDSEADQYLARAVIETYDPGLEIVQAYDGREALELLDTAAKQPDVIFLDINMPRMNGHEFLEEYSQRKNATSVVVMLTSSSQEQDREKSAAYDCVKEYFPKPLSPELLSRVL